MLSLQKCRELLGNDSTLSDATLELLRNDLYALADIATTELIEQRRDGRFGNRLWSEPKLAICLGDSMSAEESGRLFEDFLKPLSQDESEVLEERAAILEFDAGMERIQAERVVMIEHWRNRKRRGANSVSDFPRANRGEFS